MNTNEYYEEFKFARLHIPTNKITYDTYKCFSRNEFLQQLNKWNCSYSPNHSSWKYWEVMEEE